MLLLLGVGILGLYGAFIWLWLLIRSIAKDSARIFNIQLTAIRRHEAELERRDFPRYTDAVTELPIARNAPVQSRAAHDARVRDALAHPFHGAASAPRGAALPDPKDAPFFTESAPLDGWRK